jgi:hypothetical protein
MKAWAARGMIVGLLLPLWGLALVCQMPSGASAAMACCRHAHSACMQGEHAGAMSCCRHGVTAPTAVTGTQRQEVVTAVPVVLTRVLIAAVPLLRRATAPVANPSPPGTPPLYQLHSSLLI